MRRTLALAAIVALALTGTAAAAGPPVRTVTTPSPTSALPSLAADGRSVWLAGEPTAGSSLAWRVDPERLGFTARALVGSVLEVFPAGEALWELSTSRGTLGLSYVDGSGRATTRTVPAGCEATGRQSVVDRGSLWLDCDGTLAIYAKGTSGGPARTLRRAGSLVATRLGVWLDVGGSLVGLSRTAKGRTIALPKGVSTRTWVADGTRIATSGLRPAKTAGAEPTVFLVDVDLVSGKVRSRAFTIGETARPEWVVPVGDELWLVFADLRQAVRHRAKDLKVVGTVALDGAKGDGQVIDVALGAGRFWALMYTSRGTRLARVDRPG